MFAYGAVVLVTGGYSAIAGGIAVSILMLPTIILTAEDAIRMVPWKMQEAAVGMGGQRVAALLNNTQAFRLSLQATQPQ